MTQITTSYSQQQRDEALLAHYITGSTRKAAAETGVPKSTLGQWLQEHRARYEELVRQHAPKLEEQLIRRMERAVDNATKATDDALEATTEAIEQRDAKNASIWSAVARNTATAGGIWNDKSQVRQGKPIGITQHHRDGDDIITSLARMIPHAVIQGTAEEITAEHQILAAQRAEPDDKRAS